MSYILTGSGFKEMKDSTAPFIKSDTVNLLVMMN